MPHPATPSPDPARLVRGRLSLHLASDLDGTWIPAPDRLEGLRRLEAFLGGHPGISLTFATGRGLASALALLERWAGRLPDHLVTDVGTALHHRTADGRWSEDQAYALWAGARWPAGLERRIRRADLPEGVRAQPGVATVRRLALEVEPGVSLADAADRLREALERLDLPAQVLPSHGRYLDVLPPGVDKGSAVMHLGLPLALVACGDSENDLSLWRVADLPVLMADSALAPMLPGMVRPRAPGPEGILEVLRELWTRGGGG